jgi:DNA-binding CsgD family transcriptional regulator/tetratricopeptide (TPR) repeat protein
VSAGPAILDRAGELAAVSTLLEDVTGGVGGVLVFEGPPGVGKTTLTAAAAAMADVLGMDVLYATGSELESSFPFGGARQLFERRLARLDESRRARVLEGAAGHAVGALGLGEGDSASADAHVVVHGLYWVAANLALGGPLLLAVDDAHWLDQGSLRFLHYLARRVEEHPIGVVVATRPLRRGTADPSLEALVADVPVIHPGPLSRGSIAEIVRGIAGEEPDEAFVSECELASGGNALLVTALVRSLAEAGVAPTEEGAARVRDAAPEAIRRRVGTILGGVSAGARSLAHAIAVLGESDTATAGELAELDAAGAHGALAELEATGLLGHGPALRLTHPLVATAVAADMPESERSAVHARAARLLDGRGAARDAVAAHLLAALPAADPWTVERLRAAAAIALEHSAPETAVAYLQRAVSEPPPAERLAETLLELGDAQIRANRWKDASVSLLRGLAASPDDDLRHRLVMVLGRALDMSTDFGSAIDVLEEERGRLGPDDPRTVSVDGALISLAVLDADRRARVQTLRDHYEAEALAGRLDDPRLLVLIGGTSVLGARPRDEGVRLIRRALGRIDPWIDQGDMLSWALASLQSADLEEQAQSYITPIFEEARLRGDATMTARVLGQLTQAKYRSGRLAEAEAHGAAALTIYEDLGRPDQLFPNPLLDVLIERGHPDRALAHIHGRGNVGLQQHDAMTTLMRGRVLAANGQDEEALGLLLAAGEDLDTLKFLHPRFAPWRRLAAEIALRLGDRWLAQSLAEEGLELARRTQTPVVIGVALRVMGAVTGDVATLQEACLILDSHPDLLEAARAKTELGEALLRLGHREDAREPLRDALSAAHRGGATVVAERARRSLHAAGGRPRRPSLTGVEALTPSELQVARLAAEGMTNRDIAQALFITLKTVERHLNRTYAKLQIPGRPGLRGILEPAAKE